MSFTAKKRFLEFPWNYFESFLFTFALIALGILLNRFNSSSVIKLPVAPVNYVLGSGYLIVIIFAYLLYRKQPVILWLTGKPAAISSIIGCSTVILLFVIIPYNYESVTNAKHIGIVHLINTWPLLLVGFYCLTVLGMVTLRRLFPLNAKNIGFFLNHFGLWLIIMAVGLGSSDLQRLSINILKNGAENNIGITEQGSMQQLPFSVKLLDFKLSEFPPQLYFLSKKEQKNTLKTNSIQYLSLNTKEFDCNAWHIKVREFLPSAIKNDSTYYSSDISGSCTAAYVEAINQNSRDTAKGWVSTGSAYLQPEVLHLDTSDLVAFTPPKPKSFQSKITIRQDSLPPDTIILENNKPFRVGNWKLHQVSYDVNKGKWSTLSVLEAVKDPWLPLIYSGIIILLLGSLFLLWMGIIKKN